MLVNDFFRDMVLSRPCDRRSRLGALACLLVSIRLLAGVICSTCILPEEVQLDRVAHLHPVGDREPCSHGQAPAGPVAQWACTVTQDESAFILPEVPRLPVLVSFLVPLVLLWPIYRSLIPIAANGRGPPLGAC